MTPRWGKLWEDFFHSPAMMKNHTAAILFECLFIKAAHVDRVTKWGDTVRRGECDLSVRQLSELLYKDTKTIMRAMEYLEANGCIETIKTSAHDAPSIRRVVNYEKYQGKGGVGNIPTGGVGKSPTRKPTRKPTRMTTRTPTTTEVSPKGETEGVAARASGAAGDPRNQTGVPLHKLIGR